MKRLSKILLAAAVVALVFGITPDLMACEGCKLAPTSGGVEAAKIQQAGMAFSWSIMFMLVFPMTLVCALVAFAVKTCRQLDRAKTDVPAGRQ